MTDKDKLKSYYKYQPPLRFIKNKFFGVEWENLYEDKIQILYLQYALQLLWVAEVVWIEDVRLGKSRVQDLIIDELTAHDLIKVVRQYKLTYKNPWELALVILIVLINRLWFPDREENKYEVMRIKNASSISFAGKHYQAYCNKKLKDNFDTYARGNFFPLPKAVFSFDLHAEEIALYAYLMHIEDRKTFTCIAKYSTIGAALKVSNNTVATSINTYTHTTDEMRRAAASNIDRKIGGVEPSSEIQPSERPSTEIAPKAKFEAYKGKKRKPGTGYVKQLSPNCWQGRYTPTVNGKRTSYNIYAPTETECEEKLAELIKSIREGREQNIG